MNTPVSGGWRMGVRAALVIFAAVLGGHLASYSSAQLDLDRCYTCRGVCESESDEKACRCDDQCEIYGDCCGHAEERQRCNETLPPFATVGALPTFQCHSIFVEGSQTLGEGVEKAFWMVESCPTGWAGSSVEMDCKNSTMFYPVTDTNTGLVYSNEHCAACNSATDLVHWRISLVCSGVLLALTNEPNFNLTLDLLRSECQQCSYAAPSPSALNSEAVLPRRCHIHTTTCLNEDEFEFPLQMSTGGQYDRDKLLENCTVGPYSPVVVPEQQKLFRNQYCALCNEITVDTLECAGKEYQLDSCIYVNDDVSSGNNINGPGFESFSLVLDVFGDGVVVAESDTIKRLVAVICPKGEVFDPVLNDCRLTVCPEGFVLNEGTCQANNTVCPGGLVALNRSQFVTTGNATLLFNGLEYQILELDPQGRPVICPNNSILSCPQYIALTEEDVFEYINNDTVFFNGEEHRIVYVDTLGQPVICSPFSMNGTQLVNVTVVTYSYPAGFVELTYIGCSFSVLGCALTLLTYSLFKELQTVPSKVLMNLSFAILVSDLFILLSPFGVDSQNFCIAMAIILHLFSLAQFSWMSIMTFEMGRTFNHARKLAPESSQAYKTKLLLVYTLVGWSVPLIIVSASVAVNFTTDNLVLYGVTEDGDEGSCWINHLETVLIAFGAPAAVSVLFNLTVFVFISIWLFRSWRAQTKLKKGKTQIPYLRVYFALASVTGLAWVFGFVAILVGTSWSWYPFIVLQSLQGFLIFLGFLATKKVAKLYLNCLKCGGVKKAFKLSTRRFVSRESSGGTYTSRLSSTELKTEWEKPSEKEEAV